jgi:hypothetical protein
MEIDSTDNRTKKIGQNNISFNTCPHLSHKMKNTCNMENFSPHTNVIDSRPSALASILLFVLPMTDNEVNAILPEHLPVEWLRHLWVLYGNFDSRIINNYTEHQVREMWTNETRHYLRQTTMNARSMLNLEISISEKKNILRSVFMVPEEVYLFTNDNELVSWILRTKYDLGVDFLEQQITNMESRNDSRISYVWNKVLQLRRVFIEYS